MYFEVYSLDYCPYCKKVFNTLDKYNLKDYVFALIDYQNENMNIYLNTNFNNKKTSKNLFYKVDDIKRNLKTQKFKNIINEVV